MARRRARGPSPRQVPSDQVERAGRAGFKPMFGSEASSTSFRRDLRRGAREDYRDLTPSVPYILDYHILATTYDEPLHTTDPNGMQGRHPRGDVQGRGLAWATGDQLPRYADAVTMADNHIVYKNGAKEIAYPSECSITFMAKPYQTWIGNSCHVHSEPLARRRERLRLRVRGLQAIPGGANRVPEGAGDLPRPDGQLLQALRPSSWAPTTLAWGHDNSTCGFRIVGHGASLRAETRIPGGTSIPLAFAALLAAGLHGIENELEPAAGGGERLRLRRRAVSPFRLRRIDALE